MEGSTRSDCNINAPKRPVNPNTNSGVIKKCRSSVGSLSAHVETLLAADLAQRLAKAELERVQTEKAIDACADLYNEHGKPLLAAPQSDGFHRLPTRIVASLIVQNALTRTDEEHPRIAPTLAVQGSNYALNPFDLATIGVGRRGKAIASFAVDADADDDAKHRIQDALDAVRKPF